MGKFLCEIGSALLEISLKYEESSRFIFETSVISMQQIYVPKSIENSATVSEAMMLWKLILRSNVDPSKPVFEIFAQTVLLATGQ